MSDPAPSIFVTFFAHSKANKASRSHAASFEQHNEWIAQPVDLTYLELGARTEAEAKQVKTSQVELVVYGQTKGGRTEKDILGHSAIVLDFDRASYDDVKRLTGALRSAGLVWCFHTSFSQGLPHTTGTANGRFILPFGTLVSHDSFVAQSRQLLDVIQRSGLTIADSQKKIGGFDSSSLDSARGWFAPTRTTPTGYAFAPFEGTVLWSPDACARLAEALGVVLPQKLAQSGTLATTLSLASLAGVSSAPPLSPVVMGTSSIAREIKRHIKLLERRRTDTVAIRTLLGNLLAGLPLAEVHGRDNACTAVTWELASFLGSVDPDSIVEFSTRSIHAMCAENEHAEFAAKIADSFRRAVAKRVEARAEKEQEKVAEAAAKADRVVIYSGTTSADQEAFDACATLLGADETIYLDLSGRLVQVRADARRGLAARRLTQTGVRTILNRKVVAKRAGERGEIETSIDKDLTGMLATHEFSPGDYGLRLLRGIKRTPSVRNGDLVTGYDTASGFLVYLQPSEQAAIDALPAAPTKEQATAAWQTAYSFFAEFPYRATQDRFLAHAASLTMMLSPNLLGSPRPIFGVVSVLANSGKTILARATAAAILGHSLPTSAMPTGQNANEELNKVLATEVAGYSPAILFDNVRQIEQLTALEGFVTTDYVKKRRLATNESIEGENTLDIIVTGNHLQPTGDNARRFALCHLAPKVDPTTIRHAVHDLPKHLLAHRLEYVGALITLARYAQQQTSYVPTTEIGSFETWQREVLSVLQATAALELGDQAPDLASELDKAQHQDDTLDAKRDFLAAVCTKFPTRFGAAQVATETAGQGAQAKTLLTAFDGFAKRRGEFGPPTPIEVGRALADLVDAPIGPHILRKLGRAGGGIVYAIECREARPSGEPDLSAIPVQPTASVSALAQQIAALTPSDRAILLARLSAPQPPTTSLVDQILSQDTNQLF